MKNVTDSLSKGITKMNMKTSNFMEKNKYKTYIKTLEQENTSIYLSLGKLLHEKYISNNVDIDLFKNDLDKITQNLKTIEEQEEKIRNLEIEENKVLGIETQQNTPVQVNTVQTKICPNCNSENNITHRFCERCGTNIE